MCQIQWEEFPHGQVEMVRALHIHRSHPQIQSWMFGKIDAETVVLEGTMVINLNLLLKSFQELSVHWQP